MSNFITPFRRTHLISFLLAFILGLSLEAAYKKSIFHWICNMRVRDPHQKPLWPPWQSALPSRGGEAPHRVNTLSVGAAARSKKRFHLKPSPQETDTCYPPVVSVEIVGIAHVTDGWHWCVPGTSRGKEFKWQKRTHKYSYLIWMESNSAVSSHRPPPLKTAAQGEGRETEEGESEREWKNIYVY